MSESPNVKVENGTIAKVNISLTSLSVLACGADVCFHVYGEGMERVIFKITPDEAKDFACALQKAINEAEMQ